MSIGKKIKEIRTEKKMTQAQLADGFITRNMLSQIENGLATPSFATLSAIAGKLGYPIEFFVSETDERGAYIRMSAEKELKASFSCGNYDMCLKLLSNCQDDESELIAAICFEKKGIALLLAGELFSSRECFISACEHAKKSAFSSGITERAEKLVNTIDFILGRGKAPQTEFDVCGYVSELSGRSTFITRQLEARRLISGGQYSEAEKKLGALLSEAKELGAVCEYYLLADLETCLQKQGDFERAYSCADRRLKLRENMNR